MKSFVMHVQFFTLLLYNTSTTSVRINLNVPQEFFFFILKQII